MLATSVPGGSFGPPAGLAVPELAEAEAAALADAVSDPPPALDWPLALLLVLAPVLPPRVPPTAPPIPPRAPPTEPPSPPLELFP